MLVEEGYKEYEIELIDTLWNVNSERQVVIRSPQQN